MMGLGCGLRKLCSVVVLIGCGLWPLRVASEHLVGLRMATMVEGGMTMHLLALWKLICVVVVRYDGRDWLGLVGQQKRVLLDGACIIVIYFLMSFVWWV